MPSRHRGSIYIIAPGGDRARGGMGRVVSNLKREWARQPRPFRLRIIDSYGPGKRLLMPLYFAAATARVLAGCLTRRIALLHVHMAANGSTLRKGLLVYLASSFGVPVLLHLHGGDVEIFYRALGPRPRRALVGMLARADGIVVLGSYWRRFIVEELRLDPGRVHVLPNGVPDPGRRASADVPAECRILFLGDVCDNKGIPELLAALAQPQLRPLAWRMLLAGKGDSARYQALAGSLGIGERVSFLGWVPGNAANELLASSDVLVLPSRFEGLPMVVLEAMAHGLSVVATPVGAVPDAITHEETGLLVAVGDSAELAEALRRVIADATLRGRLERAARERFLRSFQITAVTQQLETIYAKYARAELGT